MDRARRAQPSANAIITRQWTMHCMEMHKKKLSKVKSRVDNKPPRKMTHLRRNLKREQMREERYSAIERENRILLQKMAKILRTNKTMDTINQYKARSLNRASRRRELIRITEENQGILQRIQASEPTYNHIEWEEDRRVMEKRLRRLSAYDREGREKVMRHVNSRRRVHEPGTRSGIRPQSAPIHRRGSDASGTSSGRRRRRARPASAAMQRRGSRSSRGSRGSGTSDLSRRSYSQAEGKAYEPVMEEYGGRGYGGRGYGGAAGAGGGRPTSALGARDDERQVVYRGRGRPASASRARGGGGRPTSAARRRPGYGGRGGGTATSLEDLDLVPGAVLEADDGGDDGDAMYEPVAEEDGKY